MSDTPAAQAPAQPAEKKPGKKRKLGWILICIVSILAGAAAPLAFGAGKLFSSNKAKPAEVEDEQASVPFGEVAVNLAEGRLNHYLRLKIVIQVQASEVADITKRVEKRKPILKDWLISHLSGKSLKDVGGSASVTRIKREIQERFEEVLYPEGESKPFEVLFEEFVVQ